MRKHLRAFVSLTKKLVAYVDHNVVVFPIICTVILALLVIFSVNGSSIGVYHKIFYGNTKDSSLLANSPRWIRSDEWVVSTERVIGQSNNDFATVNKNIGLGENESILIGAPNRDWSTLFHPDNFGFFILPFDNAFSLKWWLPAYLLVLSVYFFTLIFLPKRNTLAAIIALSFLFSPFIQWWSAYTPFIWLFVAFIAYIKIFRARRVLPIILWWMLFTYSAVSFALILYPPFLIPAFYVIAALSIGYSIDYFKDIPRATILRRAAIVLSAGIVAVGVLVLFIHAHKPILETIQNTAYPGQRIIKSGGYRIPRLFSSQASLLSQDDKRAVEDKLSPNQSEGSNFMLILPFIIAPLLYVLWLRYGAKKQTPYTVLLPLLVGVLLLAWSFIPGIEPIGKLTLLNLVQPERVIIGIGILNLICLITFIKFYNESHWRPKHSSIVIYSLLVVIFTLCVNLYIAIKSPIFMGYRWAVILSLPFAVIVYFLLRKHSIIAMSLLCIFSFFSINQIQPLYVGTTVIRDTDISRAMVEVSRTHDPNKRWVSDFIQLENFPSMNGLPSLSGTYTYPQLEIWNKLDQPNSRSIYNRYAHANFTFDRSPELIITPKLSNPGPDQLNITIEPCDPFLQKMNVGYLLTTVPLNKEQASCLSLAKEVAYPQISFYIYTTSF